MQKNLTFALVKGIAYILLVYFSLGALMPKTDFSQFARFGDLLEHYQLHQEEASLVGESISFSAFLYLHFVDGDEHQHEQESEHNNLPFQNNLSSLSLYLISSEANIPFSPSPIVVSLPHYTSFYSKDIHADIFHPPSLA